MTTPNRIELKGCGRHEEYLAGGAVKPGHLIKLNGNLTVTVHGTAGSAVAEIMIAKEDALQGNPITTAYAFGDLVGVWIVSPGDTFLGRRPAGVGDIDEGDGLMSNGDGTFTPVSAGNTSLVTCQEAVGNSGVESFIRLRRI